MEKTIWLIIMVPISALFTALGIFAWKRKKPMWFWSGSEVSKYEIRDIPAYNRANGKMWLVFSAGFWICTVLGLFETGIAGYAVMAVCIIGIPALVVTYSKIYKKYKR